MSANFSLNINLHTPKIIDCNTTGYKLRQRRLDLELSAIQLSKLCNVSKGNILKAERMEMYLNKNHLNRVCCSLKINPEKIIDSEYLFFYIGYGEPINFIIKNIGTDELVKQLKVSKFTILNWKSNKQIPSFKHRRNIIKIYNSIKNIVLN